MAAALGVVLAPACVWAAHVNVITIDNQVINPVTQQYITDAIDRSESDGALCLVLRLDTPGGLLDSTRAIVKRMMNAHVPIVVYVAPSGSRAGSAGVFITYAAHVAAMAPSTNIGAAHPVTAEGGGPLKKLIRRVTPGEASKKKDGKPEEEIVEEETRDPMTEKILNDTVAWITTIAKTRGRNEAWAKRAVLESVSETETEALKTHIVDLVAADMPDLLKQLNGRTVDLGGHPVELVTSGATVADLPMSKRQEFLAVITNPNVAYILMMLGMLGLIFEFTHPGIGFPGIAGLICLLLALYAFQALPINYVGVALVLLGLGLLIAEIKIISHGLLAVGGVISLTLGSLMLVASPDPNLRVSLQVIVPTVATLAGLILFVVQRALSIQTQRVVTGPQALIGEIGVATNDFSPEGTVFVHGESWTATSAQPIRKGEKVRIVRVHGMQLRVERASSHKEG